MSNSKSDQPRGAGTWFKGQCGAREGFPWGMTPSDLGSGKNTLAQCENCQKT